jgi:hypothetical protein
MRSANWLNGQRNEDEVDVEYCGWLTEPLRKKAVYNLRTLSTI